MTTMFQTAAQLGGIAHGLQQRKQAEARYYANPNYCLECKQKVQLIQGKRVADIRKKKFCNSTCAAKFNNHKSPKRKLSKICRSCPSLVKSTRAHCPACTAARRQRAKLRLPSEADGQLTKGQIFKLRKNWQAARTAIRTHAAETYWSSGAKKLCGKDGCTFTSHIEVCHKRAVSDFPSEAKISEINALDNLIGFCPNHHWEFDHSQKVNRKPRI